MAFLFASCAKAPPNVLVVTFDTTRYDALGFDGNPEAKTPTLDGLAKRGIVFDQAFASVPITLPSHTTMMTGLEPIVHGVHNNGKFRVPDRVETLAEMLAREGYVTAAFVSAAVLEPRHNLDQGFGVYRARTHRMSGVLNLMVPSRPAPEVTDDAVTWLAQRKEKEKPFFAWVHYFDPHQPNQPPAPFDALPDRYDGEIAYADSHLERLLDAVSAAEGSRGTLTIFTADHGESRGEHGEQTHALLAYDSTLHVPLVIAGPRVPAGVRSRALVRHIDIVPTVLEAVGLPVPDGLEGRSLVQAASSDDEADDAAVGYFESHAPHLDFGWAAIGGVRTPRWKFTATPEPRELYDVRADPRETKNLLDAEPEAAREMAELWQRFVHEHAAKAEDANLTNVSLDTLEELAALGYVQAPQDFGGEARPDPRRVVAVQYWIDDARGRAQRGHYAEAVETLETLVQSRSVRALVLRTLAPIYGEMGRTDDAVRAYRDYIALTGSEEAQLGVARILITANRAAEGLAALDEIAGKPSQRATSLRARALARLGRYTEGRELIETAYAGRRERAKLREQSTLIIDVAPFPEGEAELRKLLATAPDDPLLQSRLGYYLAVWGAHDRKEEGLALLRQAVARVPDRPELLSNLGWGEYHLGHDDEAIKRLKESLDLDSGRSIDRYRLAYPLRRQGKIAEAGKSASIALGKQPAAPWAEAARELLRELAEELRRSQTAAGVAEALPPPEKEGT